MATTLSRDTSDHTPCLISATTCIPKPLVFRFENNWLHHDGFQNVLQHGWNLHTTEIDKAKRLDNKFKNLRRVLKAWKKLLPSLAKSIQNYKEAILFMDILEEARDLYLKEWNFRELLKTNCRPIYLNKGLTGNKGE